MTSEGGVSNLNEIRDHRHLLASLKNAHTRSLRAGLLSTLARPEPVDRPDDALATEPTTPKDDPAGMDIDSDDDEDEAPPPMQVLGTRAPSSGPSSVPLPKVHPYSNFTLFPVHISQLPPPPVFSLPDEVLAIANGHLRTLEPPSEVLPPHVGPLVAASLAFLDGALLAVADATSAVGNYSERERARQRAKEREREEGGWVRVVHAMQTLQVPEDVKRRTLERLAGLYGPSPALRYRPPPPDSRPPLVTLDELLGLSQSEAPPLEKKNKRGRGKDKQKRKTRVTKSHVKSQPAESQGDGFVCLAIPGDVS